eukprot:4274480-Amphidinium_carterae.1
MIDQRIASERSMQSYAVCANVLHAVVLHLGPATPLRDVAVKRLALCCGRCSTFRASSAWSQREKTCNYE